MAQALTVDARLVRVWKGQPPGGTKICALITRAFSQTKQSNTFVVPDCTDPLVVAPLKRAIISKDASITGNGAYEPDKRDLLQTEFDDETSANWSFEIPTVWPNVAGTSGYYLGKFFLTTFTITAEEGNLVQAEMTWEADGPWSWVAYP